MNNPDFDINLNNSTVENEKTYFEIELNGGVRGLKGDKGDNGYSPTVELNKEGTVTELKITDKNGVHTANIYDGVGGDMNRSVYDTDNNGIVDNAEMVNGHTVDADVPEDAKFTDTKYTAGTGIEITEDNKINSLSSAPFWGSIQGTIDNQTDLKNALDSKVNSSDIPDLNSFVTKDTTELENYELKTNTGSSIALSIDSSTYVMTLSLKNSSGTVLNTQTVDLPLETMVVGATYDNTNKKIVLTLKNGSTIDVPVGDLVSGLQSEITSSNKLSSDLVDDTNNTNKFTTTEEKTTWNNKYTKPSGGIPKTDLESSVQTSLGKADTAIQSHQDISGKEDKTNKTTSISSSSTNTEYPSAKSVYDKINPIEEDLEDVDNVINGESTTSGTGNTINLINTLNNAGFKKVEINGNTTQDGTPTSSTPIAIETVTGRQTITITDGTNTQTKEVNLGKNLFDKGNANIINCYINQSGVIANNDTRSIYIKCKPNTTYTMQKYGSARFRIGATAEIPINGVSILNIRQTDEDGSITITTPSNAKYLVAYIYATFDTNTKTLNEVLDTIQIEQGSTASEYAPYFTPIELCKIGDNQDKIYKDNGKWYKNPKILKIDSYNGETITTSYISTTGGLDTGATVYYVNSDVTPIEITNETLTNQLNELEKATTYKDTTNITTTGNLSGILYIEAFTNTIDGRYESSKNYGGSVVIPSGGGAGDALKIGAIIPFSGDTAPNGYMICDGTAISRTEYAELFSVIGTTFGSGDGSTTFNIPNLKGKVPVGLDSNDTDFDTLGETGGSKYLQEHQHKYKNSGGEFVGSINNTWNKLGSNTGGATTNDTANTTGNVANITTGNSGNLQPYVVINYIIKATETQTGEVLSETLPVGSEIDFDGETIPTGWEQVDGPNDYSNTEKVVGTWIDGKPLYEKTIYISALPNNTGTTYNHNISNIGVRFIVNAFWQQTSGTTGPIPMYFEAAQITSCYVSNTGVYIRTNVNYSNRSAYVTLRYTKTTD